ncbi:YfdX family protein [Thalassospira lucentensis]|uniref:YfdX family protein n=1 Tax=Thalassospira lucentensis TaxID=168935 RepID=UPI003AA9592C
MKNPIRKVAMVTLIAGIAATTMTPIIANAASNDNAREAKRAQDLNQIKAKAAHKQDDKQAAINAKYSEQAFQAIQKVRAARIAIAAEDIDHATTLINQAQKSLSDIKKDGAKGILTINVEQIVDENVLVPASASTSASADKTSAAASKATATKASDTTQKADKAAPEMAQTSLGTIQVLMPLDATIQQLNIAANFMKDTKPFDASRALATAEAGLAVQSFYVVGQPQPINPDQNNASASS